MNKILLILVFNFFFINIISQEIKSDIEKALTTIDSSDFYFSKIKKNNKSNKDWVLYYSAKTEYCSKNKKLDSAVIYGAIAINKIKKLDFSQNIDLMYPVYRDVSQSYRRKGEYEKAIEIVLKGLKLAEKHNNQEWIVFYNCMMSLNYHDFESYQKGVFYGKKALLLAKKFKRESFSEIWKSLNATAINYDDWNKPDSALFYHYKAVKLAKGKDTLGLISTFNNIGNTLLKQKQFQKARKFIKRADKICNFKYINKPKDFGYYYDKSTQINNLATIAFELNEYENAEKYFDSSFYYSKKSVSAEKLRDYYDQRTKFNKKRGNLKEAFFYQEKYVLLRDSIFVSERATTFAELETKYQTTKKEKLLLVKDAEAKQKNMWLLIISVLTLFTGLIGFLIYRQQKLKNAQQEQEFQLKSAISQIENQNKLQEQRLSISRDLHDNIGSQLTFIISSVDNVKYGFDIQNEKLDNKLTNISSFAKDTIVELRDTIWAMNSNEITYEDLEIRINNYIEKAKEAKEKISFSFAIDESLKTQKLTSVEGMNIYRTIQEAINNSIKYAQAEIISVNVKNQNNQTKITITDNGIGFDNATIEKGNGLQNMKKRIEEIGGKFDLKSSDEGTRIEILI